MDNWEITVHKIFRKVNKSKYSLCTQKSGYRNFFELSNKINLSLSDSLIDWVTNDQLTDWLCWLKCWLTDWSTFRTDLNECLTNWLTDTQLTEPRSSKNATWLLNENTLTDWLTDDTTRRIRTKQRDGTTHSETNGCIKPHGDVINVSTDKDTVKRHMEIKTGWRHTHN